LKVATSSSPLAPQQQQSAQQQREEASPGAQAEDTGILSSLTKQRLRLNMRLLSFSGQQHSSLKQAMKEDRPTYREQFVPPEMSFLALLMTKVRKNSSTSSGNLFQGSARAQTKNCKDKENSWRGRRRSLSHS
jgi:hypothetical protein